MKTPYIGFSNETLKRLPLVSVGEEISCDKCGGKHVLRGDDNGGTLLMFYSCGGKSYLGAVDGRLTAGQKTDCHGEL